MKADLLISKIISAMNKNDQMKQLLERFKRVKILYIFYLYIKKTDHNKMNYN